MHDCPVLRSAGCLWSFHVCDLLQPARSEFTGLTVTTYEAPHTSLPSFSISLFLPVLQPHPITFFVSKFILNVLFLDIISSPFWNALFTSCLRIDFSSHFLKPFQATQVEVNPSLSFDSTICTSISTDHCQPYVS